MPSHHIPMSSPVMLHAHEGQLIFGGDTFSASTRAAHLPGRFDLRDMLCQVDGRPVPCRFARATQTVGGTRYALELRFERERLVGMHLSIEPKQHQDLDDATFYASVDERWRFHERWLANVAGVKAGAAEFDWGSLGVARDKSENVWIYLHMRPHPSALA